MILIENDFDKLRSVIEDARKKDPRLVVMHRGLHYGYHIGHKLFAEKVYKICNYVVAVIYANDAYLTKKILPENKVNRVDRPDLLKSDIEQMSYLADVVFVWKDDYYPSDMAKVKKIIFEQMSDERLDKYGCGKDYSLKNSMRGAQATRYSMYENGIHFNMGISSDKDTWRKPFADWVNENTGCLQIMISCFRDKYGNAYSSGRLTLDEKYLKKIDFQILPSYINNIEDLRLYLDSKNMQDMEILNFQNTQHVDGQVHARFVYKGHVWSEATHVYS